MLAFMLFWIIILIDTQNSTKDFKEEREENFGYCYGRETEIVFDIKVNVYVKCLFVHKQQQQNMREHKNLHKNVTMFKQKEFICELV